MCYLFKHGALEPRTDLDEVLKIRVTCRLL